MKKLIIWSILALLFVFNPFEQPSLAAENLQQLIDDAAPNSTLQLENKTYNGPVTISKPLKIIGRENTKITSDSTGLLIENATDVQLANIQIETLESPLRIKSSETINLSNLTFTIHDEPIRFDKVQNSRLSNIQITGMKDVHFSQKPNGIEVYDSSQIEVDGAQITNIQDGIYFEEVKDVTVKNSSASNGRYGFHFMYGENIELVHNHVKNNVTGFTIMVMKKVVLLENIIEKQLALNSNGIYLYDIDGATIKQNLFKENTIAAVWKQIQNTTFSHNTFQSNGTVIQSKKSPEVIVESNDFLGNILSARADKVGFVLKQNHYDDYDGYDFNEDGYGDTPYQSYTSFGQWMVRKPVYQYYIEAPSVVLLNTLDKQLPALEKNNLVDEQPIMKGNQRSRDYSIHWFQLFGGLLATLFIILIWRKFR